MISAVKALFDLLLPRLCVGCQELLNAGERVLCTSCRHHMPLTHFYFGTENEMDRSLYGRASFTKASSFLFYSKPGICERIIHQLKYQDQEYLGQFLGQWYGFLLKEDSHLAPIDYIVPVPIHWFKKSKRGYNQLDLFCKTLAQVLGSKTLTNLLVKKKINTSQTKKSRVFRNLNEKNPFQLKHPQRIANKRILLVDDVMTTGATLVKCLSVLNDANPKGIYVVTIGFVSRFE